MHALLISVKMLIKMKNQPSDGFYEKRCLKFSQNSQENTCVRIDSVTGFPCEFYENFKNMFFTEPLSMTAPVCLTKSLLIFVSGSFVARYQFILARIRRNVFYSVPKRHSSESHPS